MIPMSSKTVITTEGQVLEYSDAGPDALNVELGKEMAKRTDKLNDDAISIALRVKQAREFLAWSTAHMRSDWLDWLDESKKASQEMNMFRMAFERETKTITAAAKDIREFFNSPDYRHAHDKLNEMVALLNDFERLKKNGTLDAFADFILKVSCK